MQVVTWQGIMKKGSRKSQFINECSLCYRQQVGWLSEKCFDWLISSLTDWLVDWKVLSLCEQLTDKCFVWHMTVCTWPTCVCNTQLQLWPAFAYSWLQNGPGTRYVPSPLLIFFIYWCHGLTHPAAISTTVLFLQMYSRISQHCFFAV